MSRSKAVVVKQWRVVFNNGIAFAYGDSENEARLDFKKKHPQHEAETITLECEEVDGKKVYNKY